MVGEVHIDIKSYNKLLKAFNAMEKVESLVTFELEKASRKAMVDAENGSYPIGYCSISAEDICNAMDIEHYKTFEALHERAIKVFKANRGEGNENNE